jgi:hypothetical protein
MAVARNWPISTGKKKMLCSVRPVPTAMYPTTQYVMPPLSNNGNATEVDFYAVRAVML